MKICMKKIRMKRNYDQTQKKAMLQHCPASQFAERRLLYFIMNNSSIEILIIDKYLNQDLYNKIQVIRDSLPEDMDSEMKEKALNVFLELALSKALNELDLAILSELLRSADLADIRKRVPEA